MKRILYNLLLVTLPFSGSCVLAQERVWTLEECINHAIENNIDLKQKALETQSREIQLNTSRFSWVPEVSAYVGQEFSFGRSLSNENTYVDQNSASTNGSLSAGMPLFDGFYIPNDISAKKLNLLASFESLNKAKEDLAMNVASYYIQTLYNKEIFTIAELQVVLSTEQTERTEKLVDAGKVPLSQLYDAKAQLAKDEVTLAEAYNNVRLSLLDLAQLLELERDGGRFDITAPDIEDAVVEYMGSILPADDIYDHAVLFKPEIREQEYLLQSNQKTLKMAQSGYYPKLNLNAGYGSGYYHYYNSNMINVSFSDQLRNNQRKYVGLTLNIPIFSRFRVRNDVRSARVEILNRELIMENTKKTLYKEIQQSYYNATAAQDKLMATEKAVQASETAFAYAEERYNAGKSTAYEFNEAKTKLAQSLSEQAQAKYDFILRAKILDFYNGIPIRL